MGGSTGGQEPARAERRTEATAEQMVYAGFARCGSHITLETDSRLPLQLALTEPVGALRGADNPAYAHIGLSVRNLSAAVVSVMTLRSGARMAISKDGAVVVSPGGARAAGSMYTIAPGGVHEYQATVDLIRCHSEARLMPGAYQLHALQRFRFLDRNGEQAGSVLVYGGPWDVEVG